MEDDIEPIKASTLAQFEFNPVDAFIEHLREIGDSRVDQTPKESEALRQGSEAHGEFRGFRVYVMDEDTGEELLRRWPNTIDEDGSIAAVNFEDYQIQGVPDALSIEDDATAQVVEMKTTGWDDRTMWETHQLPLARFQSQIYSWMLSATTELTILDPKIAVKRRIDDGLQDWFTVEPGFDRDDVEEHIEHVLSMLEQPEELTDRRPDEDWKNDHWDEFVRLGFDESGQQTLTNF